jgi:hypothetical protein
MAGGSITDQELLRRRWSAFTAIGYLLALGLVAVGCGGPLFGRLERVVTALTLGTIFSQATLVSIWTALGFGSLANRVPLALAWLVVVWIALAILHWHSPLTNADIILLSGSALLQWSFTQIPLWGGVWWSGLSIQDSSTPDPSRAKPTRQFGIRQLMTITAALAIALGVGRLALTMVPWELVLPKDIHVEAPAFLFLIIVNVLATLPLALGALVPSGAAPACVVGLAIVGAATVVEVSVVRLLVPGGGRGSELPLLLGLMNACQAAWILAVLLLIRRAGYRLVAMTPQSSPER